MTNSQNVPDPAPAPKPDPVPDTRPAPNAQVWSSYTGEYHITDHFGPKP